MSSWIVTKGVCSRITAQSLCKAWRECVNFTNILRAALPPIFLRQKSIKPNIKYKTSASINFVWKSWLKNVGEINFRTKKRNFLRQLWKAFCKKFFISFSGSDVEYEQLVLVRLHGERGQRLLRLPTYWRCSPLTTSWGSLTISGLNPNVSVIHQE